MGMLTNPYRFVTAAGTAGYLTGENLSEQTFTTGTVDCVTLSGASLKASTNYFLFASVDAKSSSTSNNPVLQVYNGATKLNIMDPTYISESAGNDYRNLHFVTKVTTSATPSSDSWILRLARFNSNVATHTWKNARIVMLEVGANDKFSSDAAHKFWTSPTNETSQTAVSLTDTFSGDYLFLAFFTGDKVVATNTNFTAELTDGTTTTGEQWVRMGNTDDRASCTLPLTLTGLAGSKTITLKVREQNTGATTIGVGDCCIVALKLSRFANVYSDQDTSTGNTVASTSYVATNVDQTFTPAAGAHLVLAGGMSSTNASAVAYSARVDDGGTTINEISPRTTAFINTPFLAPRIATYTATSRRQKIDHLAASGSVSTWQPFIFTLDLAGI